MRYHPVVAALLLGASLALSSCNSKPATDAHEEEAHATQPKPAPVAIPPNLRVPVEALIRDGDASYLWKQTGARQYRRVRVSTGEGSASSVPITAGRPAGARVVVSGAYLLQSEYSLRQGATDSMNGMSM